MRKTVVSTKSSYLDQPCDRCGSPKQVSKTWMEEIETIMGTSMIEVSQTKCTNKICQELFDENREKELLKINERKMQKELQDKVRRDNIARTISERKKKLA